MYKRIAAALALFSFFCVSAHAELLGDMRASWYGLNDGSGSHTASGMRFSPDNPHIVAYYRNDQFEWGTRFLLTNLENGRQLCVSVQDYGPAVPGRKLDLTHAGAVELGFARAGTAMLQVERRNCRIPRGFIPEAFN